MGESPACTICTSLAGSRSFDASAYRVKKSVDYPYRVTPKLLQCPSDLKASNYFLSRGSSYQWSPMLDGELKVNPVVYGRRGGARTVNPARMRLCMDFEPVHFNRANRLYADGHVVAAMK